MKTSYDQVESESYQCFENLAYSSLVGAGIASAISLLVLKSRLPAILYGAGFGAGLSVHQCQIKFEELNTEKKTYPAEAETWVSALAMMGRVLNANS
ncbi:unnamed protein product [Blepharisma stoltei]|uniref:MICOS complex subunit MIC10 n=1 Tax=Blepharisma stoltei TaxID=1481888 RepID=A0AAU9IU04_9CILI|nr:unnamed protein product [Blepharisma stoltei]